jgi:type IV secretion system protein VirB9
MRWFGFFVLVLAPGLACAQTVPMPQPANLRLQTVEWKHGEDVLLTVLPGGSLTVVLEEGETIERVTALDGAPLNVRVTPEGSAFTLIPEAEFERAGLLVESRTRQYRFTARTQESPLAALVVTFIAPASEDPVQPASRPEGLAFYSYRFRGDVAVRPLSVRDDARRTFVEYAPDQALPAVFAIGPTGEEEVVNGHMRDGLYVIDRVYDELVFRIDRERATARRNPAPDQTG